MSVVDLKPKTEPTGPFVVGSTVKLKSGGAIMTVRKSGKSMVECDWHNASNDPIFVEYRAEQLGHADPDKDEEKDESAK